MKEDLLNDFEEDNNNTSSYESRPMSNEYDVFYLRNNPEPLIEDFYLYLTNKVKNINPESNHKNPYIQIPNTKPLLNMQGVRDLVNFMRTFINGHTVQTNLKEESLNRTCRHLADDSIMFIINSLDDWGLPERYARSIHNELIAKIELFLRRGLDDKEREHYSQEQRHEYSHASGGEGKKKSLNIPSNIKNMFSS